MKTIFFSRKFLTGAVSFFVFFFVFFSSFFFSINNAHAECSGSCMIVGCATAGMVPVTDGSTCLSIKDWCCVAPPADTCIGGTCSPFSCGSGTHEQGTCPNGTVAGSICCMPDSGGGSTASTCNGTCMVGGCAGFTAGTGTCSNGGSCCSSQPAPTTSTTNPTCNASVFSGGLVSCGKGSDASAAEECNFEQFICLLQRLMNFMLFVLAVPLAAISFAWAGWLYLSAAGNEGNIKQAHQIFGDVVLGLCLALSAWLIVHAIVTGLGVDSQYNFLGS